MGMKHILIGCEFMYKLFSPLFLGGSISAVIIMNLDNLGIHEYHGLIVVFIASFICIGSAINRLINLERPYRVKPNPKEKR